MMHFLWLWQKGRGWLLLLFLCGVVGCYRTPAEAVRGLPCVETDDCPRFSCIRGFCGGPVEGVTIEDASPNDSAECTSGQSRTCYTGGASSAGVGECKEGRQSCDNGRWGLCLGETIPIKEICDQLDNDCDGKIDNIPELGQDCEDLSKPTGCQRGVWRCSASGKRCVTKPSEEICDGKDNDCNGLIDDALNAPVCDQQDGVCRGLTKRCGGSKGWLACSSGDFGQHNEAYEKTESKCDGLDNDCDGKVDNIALPPRCTKQSGVCNGARQICGGKDTGWIDCTDLDYAKHNAAYEATETKCDGLDNNCDGGVDNIATAPLCSKQKGVCKGTRQRCDGSSGKWLPCNDNDYARQSKDYQVLEKRCDGVDNDCNGFVDGAFVECGPGTYCDKGACQCDLSRCRGCCNGDKCIPYANTTMQSCAPLTGIQCISCNPLQADKCQDVCFCGKGLACTGAAKCKNGKCECDPPAFKQVRIDSTTYQAAPIKVTAGTQYQLSLEFELSTLPNTGREQLVIAHIAPGYGVQPVGCIFDGLVSFCPNRTKRPASVKFSAPRAPGVYDVAVIRTDAATCAAAMTALASATTKPSFSRLAQIEVPALACGTQRMFAFSADLNGKGPEDKVTANSAVSLKVAYIVSQPVVGSIGLYQLVLVAKGPNGFVGIGCLYNGFPPTCPKNTNQNKTLTFAAPSLKGRYQIRYMHRGGSGCTDAINTAIFLKPGVETNIAILDVQ